MAELSDEKVRAIRDHLFAVAELPREVPAPGDGAKSRVVPLKVFWSAIDRQSEVFTQYAVRETLAAGGVEMAAAAVTTRLNSLVRSGLLESPYRGHFRRVQQKKANGHG